MGLEGILTDLAYASRQLEMAKRRKYNQHPALLGDTVQRALDAVERVQCELVRMSVDADALDYKASLLISRLEGVSSGT